MQEITARSFATSSAFFLFKLGGGKKEWVIKDTTIFKITLPYIDGAFFHEPSSRTVFKRPSSKSKAQWFWESVKQALSTSRRLCIT